MSAPTSLTDEDRASACRQSFALFNAMAFAAVNPGVVLQPAPYLQLLAGKLQQMVDGTVRNLIVTLPPRGLKSFTVSVALPAYILGLDPGRQVMCVSYGQELAQGLGRDRLKLMTHPLYRSTFPESRLSQASVRKLTTPERGAAYATSIDAPATGFGADWLIFDDPQKAQGTLSEQTRASTNAQFEQTFLSRRNDPATARIIVVMQRLHEDDFVGHVLGLGGLEWDVLNLPAIAEEDEEHAYETPFGERVFRRKAGEALHPTRISVEELREIEKTMGSARFATQYQQRPAPAGGGLVQAKWFNRYSRADLPERFDEVIQSWDTANTISEFADWTVCTTWGRLGESVYLLHVHRERMLFPHLLRAARRMADRFDPDVVLVEDHASGTQLIQMLREEGFGKCRPVKPVGDKKIRMTNQTALIESGRVWLPSDADWVQTYLHELVLFPNGRHDDQVDSTSQALDWLSGYFDGRGLLEFYRQEAAAVTKQAQDLPPERLDWPWWKMRCRFDDVTAHCTTGEYRNGEQGWVWIPKYEARDLMHSGNWDKIGEYEPPAKLRAWS